MLMVDTSPAPRERGEGLNIEYMNFSVASPPGEAGLPTRLRAVIASPAGSASGPLPALLMVAAHGSARLFDSSGYSPTRSLGDSVARAGYRVLRFELPVDVAFLGVER